MAKTETDISHNIILDLAPLGVRLFKNVRGLFLTLDGKRKVLAGLQPKGSSDLIGYTITEITPEMVGQKLPIFTVIETKTEIGKASDEQNLYLNVIRKHGGNAGIARNTLDAKKICKK